MACCWCDAPKQHKNKSGCAGAKRFNLIPAARKSEIAREAGRTKAICEKADVIERYVHLDREDAIWHAWKDSRNIARWQRYRARTRKSA